ncbi:TetR/AcrR family transcriptional regulator [Paenibacillus sp. P26]|nr:TetR/AcrR family transcriptional regulator [Paenibacillus sp. P26]
MKTRKHTDSKREDILQAAIQLFSRKSVSGVSVKEIGSVAGVTDAAIYKHFPSKDAVAEAVFAYYSDLYTKVIDHAAKGDGTFPHRLDRLVQEIIEMHDRDRFGLLLLGQHPENFARLAASHRLPYQALAEFIAAAVKDGELPAQDPKLSAAMVIGIVTRIAVFSDTGGLSEELRPLLPEIQRRSHGLLGLP